MFSQSEENYLKAIYSLELDLKESINTNLIAEMMETKASSVTDMIKKLDAKKLISYQKYKGVNLTAEGRKVALSIIRKHRLWETFLVDKLNYSWHEVHDIAEQLEHIQSKDLINKLDEFLGFPSSDPHGDPIPDKDGKIIYNHKSLLSNFEHNKTCIVVGVKDSSKSFLKFLEKIKITLGSTIIILNIEEYDNSFTIEILGKEINISNQIAKNIFIKPEN